MERKNQPRIGMSLKNGTPLSTLSTKSAGADATSTTAPSLMRTFASTLNLRSVGP